MVRWDPKSRAGAIAFRLKSKFDLQAQQDMEDSVNDWAAYQNLGGDVDNVETSPVTGVYDWRGYLLEESEIAHRREADRIRSREKKAQRPPPPPAPSHLYA